MKYTINIEDSAVLVEIKQYNKKGEKIASQDILPADPNPSTCPNCGEKNFHHTTACYLGLKEEEIIWTDNHG